MTAPAFDTAACGRWLASAPLSIHMIGIGGVGMAGLAHLLASAGHRVSGTELVPNPWTDELLADGVSIAFSHGAEHVAEDVDLCIHTTAVPPTHPEALQALALGACLLRRGQVLAAVSHRPGSVAVSGTHGKTTTTSMIHFLLTRLGVNPDYFIGAQPAHTNRLSGWAGSDYFCFEADESDGTLVHYHPDTAVITNIDFDHMEHHADEEAFFRMFQTFADQAQTTLICPFDDVLVKRLVLRPQLQVLRFGLGEGPGIRARVCDHADRSIVFDVSLHGRDLGPCRLGVPGLHNVKNALAALAVVDALGLDVVSGAARLADYRAASRRMETLFDRDGLRIITDYAHHPAELSAVLDTVELWSFARTVVVFQPHRYTRTLALKEDFSNVLSRADVLVLVPVYAASEAPIEGGRIEDLEQAVRPQTAGQVLCVPDLKALRAVLEDVQRPGDLLLFLGAGDIDAEARAFAQRLTGEDAG